MSASDYLLVYWSVASVFGSVFLFFLVRDYRRLVSPLQKEIKGGNKYCITFYARKYADPIYDKFLLFYPGKENLYIELSQEEFSKIGNGQQLHLEYACITGEVLGLRTEEETFTTASEFSFSDMPPPKFFKNYY